MRASFEEKDEELLGRSLAGDEAAFCALYRRRQAGLYRFALQMCGSEGVAEDVVQEVFMTLLRDGTQFDAARGALSSYLYGIARNQVLRRLEKERPFVTLADEKEDETGADAFADARPDPLAELAQSELVERVRGAVLTLPAHYREVVVLCELHEMSYAEAAAVLGCAVGTVRSRLHRARAMLCERLSAYGGGEQTAKSFNAARCFA
jgi:RNA polymerase sigma-70 factor (ECF subfamily)